jgi:hypothetical protein
MIYPFSKYDILATDFTTKAMIHIYHFSKHQIIEIQ